MQLIDTAPLLHFPMPFHLRWRRRVLHFRRPAATSRGALKQRVTCTIEASTGRGCGYGECCVMPGLLPEPAAEELDYWCAQAEQNQGLHSLPAPSPVRFGLECALLAALRPGQPRWDTHFSRGEAGIPIHHLIWMDNCDAMLEAMQRGVEQGFTCLKMKVGALPFHQELELIRQAHQAFPKVELRVDANGAFAPEDASARLDALAHAGVSLIEQPIRPGQWREMAALCRSGILPVALDEELIGCDSRTVLDTVAPQAIVIKPSLHGGLLAAQNWATEAGARGIRWWVNSALESHIGLTALAEWCAYAAPGTMQALGTGRLFADDEAGCVHLDGNHLKMRRN